MFLSFKDPRLRTEGAPEHWTCSKEVGIWKKNHLCRGSTCANNHRQSWPSQATSCWNKREVFQNSFPAVFKKNMDIMLKTKQSGNASTAANWKLSTGYRQVTGRLQIISFPHQTFICTVPAKDGSAGNGKSRHVLLVAHSYIVILIVPF